MVLPLVTFSASPSTINKGASSTLGWTTVFAHNVKIDGATVSLSGSKTVYPSSTKTYTLVAIGAGGTVSKSVTVTVIQPPPPPPPPPPPEEPPPPPPEEPPPPPPPPEEPPPEEPPPPPPAEPETLAWFIAIFGEIIGPIIYNIVQHAESDAVDRTVDQIIQTFYTINEWWLAKHPEIKAWIESLDESVRLEFIEMFNKSAQEYDEKLGTMNTELLGRIAPLEAWQEQAYVNIAMWWIEQQQSIYDELNERDKALHEYIDIGFGMTKVIAEEGDAALWDQTKLMDVKPPSWLEKVLIEVFEKVATMMADYFGSQVGDIAKGIEKGIEEGETKEE